MLDCAVIYIFYWLLNTTGMSDLKIICRTCDEQVALGQVFLPSVAFHQYRQMYWLLGRRSTLSLRNKLVLYTEILKPVWTYGIQLWGCAAQSTIAVIQRFQNKVLRGIVNAPWYIRNTDLHRDLNMEMVTAVIRRFARKHEARLHQHSNP